MPEDNDERRVRVYVSCSRKDRAFVEPLLAALDAAGFDAFADNVDYFPGEDWRYRLEQMIEMADAVVHVVSPASAASDFVTWEIGFAREQGKQIVRVDCREVADVENLCAAEADRIRLLLDKGAAG